MTIWSSVRSDGTGAIITPAAPLSITARLRERMAAKPGADTPTMTGSPAMPFTKRAAMSSDSSGSSFGASPMMPSTVTPVAPAAR
ncbi:hypothetical protein ROTAS13_04101 [Roseomonas sp. TAS13]|nr:hypothetical protein ROTAS13_04101 [Roseomonas sp. TAS13]